MTIAKLLEKASKKLRSFTATPLLDAEVLLSCMLHKPRYFLYSHPEKNIAKNTENKFIKLVERRKKAEPIAYITGSKEFFSLQFLVNKNVLIPRPDTELMVEEALKLLSGKNTIVDVGTGSGCVAIAVKKNSPKSLMLASDISSKALAIAKKNAKLNNTKIIFFKSDLLKNIPAKYKNKIDLILFNPPYLTKNEAKKKSLRYEPQIALTPNDFQKLLNSFFKQSQNFMAKNGFIMLESGHKQSAIVKRIALKYYPLAKIVILKDLGGFNRLMKILT
ncbi:MAG: peptide chain release factor N(5)-glutamine methyltransferase [Patescibacteria group bacterium]|jgi:release factor glutamine methyltransferase